MSIESDFQTLYATIASRNEAIRELHDKVMVLEKEIEAIAEPYEKIITETQEKIKSEVLASGKSFKCNSGKATFKKEYERHSWDDKALMGYAAVHPVVEQFRKTTVIPASVSITIGDL